MIRQVTQYHYFRAVLPTFPLAPDQVRAQILPACVRGVFTYKTVNFKGSEIQRFYSKIEVLKDVALNISNHLSSAIEQKSFQ